MFHCTCGGQKTTGDSLYHMSPGIEPQVIRHDSKHLSLLNHLAGPQSYIRLSH